MRLVVRPLSRVAALLLAAPFLTFASGLAAAHVHEPEPGDHDHAVAHSHFAPHLEIHEATEGPEFDHNDGHVVWLDSAILHESVHQAGTTPPAVPVSYDTVQPERSWAVTPFDDAAPVHGPPRAAVRYRGPPLLLTSLI
jgi:hypothetical protein